MTREQVDNMVNTWLDVFLSTGGDVAIQGPSLLARLIEFHGDIPRGSGYYPSDVVMIAAASTCRPKPPGYDLINGTVFAMLKRYPLGMRALLLKHGYQGLNEITGKTFTHEDRAAILGVKLGEFKNLLKAAYGWYSDIYIGLEEYEALKH